MNRRSVSLKMKGTPIMFLLTTPLWLYSYRRSGVAIFGRGEWLLYTASA